MIAASRIVRGCAAIAVLVSCVGCDQVTKHIAVSRLKARPPMAYCGNVFRLEYAENPGAFLGLGQRLPEAVRRSLFVGLDVLIAVALAGTLVVRARMARWHVAACALFLSGTIGNLIDRLRFDGGVIDFLNVGVGPLRTGIFNVADMAIMAGALILTLPALVAGGPPVAADSPPRGR